MITSPPSISNAINGAMSRTGTVLFQPFDLGKWFLLGFCAFLAYLGQGGGSFYFPQVAGGGGGGGTGTGPTPAAWFQANFGLIITISLIVLLIVVAITVVLAWLRGRGKFMFVDGLARNRGAVAEPWRVFRELGNSHCLFSIVVGFTGTVVILASLLIAGLIAWPDIQANRFETASVAALCVAILFVVPVSIALTVIGLLLEDFVVPTMYLRRLGVLDAWSIAHRELITPHLGTIILFYLMKLLLVIAVSCIAGIATCATCCVVAVPYIGTVILLPLIVFLRCYTLCFIEQFGPEWRIFHVDGHVERCAHCGYDLRWAAGPGVCPECGAPFAGVDDGTSPRATT